ncbi:hypothetical protein [Tenacibaculum sp. 190524A05c]|uniref:hypothetical protein n=1 Tax=Tenacibaculum platacis TaxID=3137852 RepID=UPI0032B2BCE5
MIKNTSFVVVNGMADVTLTNISIIHEGDFIEFNTESLSPGEASKPIPFESNGNNDYWDISFYIEDKRYVRYQKECGLRDKDENQITVISLYKENFSVVTPQSGGCYNNDYDTMKMHTSANISITNQTKFPLRSEVKSKTDITSSINYFNNREVPANSSSTIIGIQTEGVLGQSKFKIGLNSNKEGEVSFNLGSKISASNTKVTSINGSPNFAGFVSAKAPFGFGVAYDLYLYAGQSQAAKLINSFFEANLKAVQSFINKNGYTIDFKDKFNIQLTKLSGLENSESIYTTLKPCTNVSEKNSKKFKFTSILNNEGKVNLNTSFISKEKKVDLNDAYIKDLQILLEGNLSLNLSKKSLSVDLTTFKVYCEDYSLDLSVLDNLFPIVAKIN